MKSSNLRDNNNNLLILKFFIRLRQKKLLVSELSRRSTVSEKLKKSTVKGVFTHFVLIEPGLPKGTQLSYHFGGKSVVLGISQGPV